jgi:hypothetical protein
MPTQPETNQYWLNICHSTFWGEMSIKKWDGKCERIRKNGKMFSERAN